MLCVLALALLAAPALAAGCSSSLDCALNGECVSGACVCDSGWRGADCSALDLVPAAQVSGLHVQDTSSWGGSVLPYVDVSGETVMFASVFYNCGLTSWTRNSYIARTSSAGGLDAPFTVQDVAIPLWSHNVVALNATGFDVGVAESAAGSAFLIFHIGDGTQSNSSLQACSPAGNPNPAPTLASSSPSASYTYSPGFLPAGDDVYVAKPGEMASLAAAEAWCTANVSCVALTYEGPEGALPGNASVFFKANSGGGTQSSLWSTFSRDLPPGPPVPHNGTSQCGLLWFSCDAPPLCDDMPAIDGFDCVSYACSGDDQWGEGGGAAGASGLRDDVDCGLRIKDVNLSSCVGAAECGAEAAGACEATPGCNAFGISSFLDEYRFAMLFSAGREGLRPNAQWNSFVRKNATARPSPAPGRGRALPTASRALVDNRDGDGSSFPVSFATSITGPWTTVYANTTSPTNGNNPAPFLARNGSVYVVFNDGGMSMFRSDTGVRGPYNLVTRGTCGGGEDPVIWLGRLGWHCLYHRGPFSDPNHQAIGHAYSADGFEWHQSPSAAATSVIEYDDGNGGVLNVTFGKRERPHLLFDPASGEPIAFISGVGINPLCDPFVFSAAGVPSIDANRLAEIATDPHCQAWVQYQRLDLNPAPAYYDRSWTHVQRIRKSSSSLSSSSSSSSSAAAEKAPSSVAASSAATPMPTWSAPYPNASLPLAGFPMLVGDYTKVVFRGSLADGDYNHAAMLHYHEGIITISWKNGIEGSKEDAAGQRVLVVQSADGGATFSEARELFGSMNTSSLPLALFAGPFAVVNGRLYASASPGVVVQGSDAAAQGAQFCLWPDGLDPRNAGPPGQKQPVGVLILRRVLAGVGSFGPAFWAAGGPPQGYGPGGAMASVISLNETDAQTQADVAALKRSATDGSVPCGGAGSGTTKCEACAGGCQPYAPLSPADRLANERAHWIVPAHNAQFAGTDVIMYRCGSGFFYASSRLRGAPAGAWAPVALSGVPNDNSNLNAGTLPDGRVYLVHNPLLGKIRDPLTVAVSDDGLDFSAAGVALTCTSGIPGSGCGGRVGGNNVGPSYPQALAVGDPAPAAHQGFYVVATNNKEDVVVTRIPFAALPQTARSRAAAAAATAAAAAAAEVTEEVA